MLVLSRKRDEKVVIGDGEVTITVVEIRGDKVRLGIEAPASVPVHRFEVFTAIKRGGRQLLKKVTDALSARPNAVPTG